MRKINYPLIVTDFDGTLVKADGTISEETKNSITEYIQNGGHFVISTGRMPAGILPRARELGLKGMLSCGQGSVILPGDLPDPGTDPGSSALQVDSLPSELSGKPSPP